MANRKKKNSSLMKKTMKPNRLAAVGF